jgi:hypothetical protein
MLSDLFLDGATLPSGRIYCNRSATIIGRLEKQIGRHNRTMAQTPLKTKSPTPMLAPPAALAVTPPS